jgi:hypothetical protein
MVMNLLFFHEISAQTYAIFCKPSLITTVCSFNPLDRNEKWKITLFGKGKKLLVHNNKNSRNFRFVDPLPNIDNCHILLHLRRFYVF